MADVSMNGRGFAPQAGSYQAYQNYQGMQAPQNAPQAAGYGYAQYAQHPAQSPSQQPQGNPVKAVAALTGAGLSIALLVGVGVWGYKLMARDVAGVPVVRAVQGEMRVRPQDPGGAQAQNQGLAVNEVAAAGGTAGPSERIILAPEPIDLADDSTPLIDQLVQAQPRFGEAGTSGAQQARGTAVSNQELSQEMASIQALADQIAAGAKPLTTEEVAVATVEPVKASVTKISNSTGAKSMLAPRSDVIPAATPGVAVSMRPKVRPAGVRTASLNAAAPTAAQSVREVSPESIPAGTRLVQLGAYESPEIARKEWERFTARFADYMDGKDRVVQKATSGGRTFYRLRAMGFEDLADARRFCSALTAQNTDCIPVVTR